MFWMNDGLVFLHYYLIKVFTYVLLYGLSIYCTPESQFIHYEK